MTSAVFLLPGLDGTGKLLRPLKEALRAHYEVSIIEYGESSSFERLVEEVEAQIPMGRDVSIVAESFSGPIAIEVLARRGGGYWAVGIVRDFCYSTFTVDC